MKIAVVHSFYTAAQPSGENSVVLDQVDALRAAGHDVKLISRHTDEESLRSGYAARSAIGAISGRGPDPSRELEKFGPDIVHLHNTFPNWGVKWLADWGHRTVMTLHNFRSLCANGLLFRDGHSCHDCLTTPVIPAVGHRCYRNAVVPSLVMGVASSPRGALRGVPNRCAGLIALNPGAAELFEAQFGRRVHVIPNFVPRAHDRVSTSRRAGWLYVGRLTREKGVDRLLGSWPKGEALDLVGDGPLAVEAQELAERNPLVRRLGMIPRSEVLERMGRYEGLILPSMAAEQMPTVVLEALAAGVPCILSQHVAAGAALKSEGVAVLYDPSAAPEHLAEALSKVRATGGRMSAAALRVFEANYSPESWRHEVEGLYDAILGDTSSIT